MKGIFTSKTYSVERKQIMKCWKSQGKCLKSMSELNRKEKIWQNPKINYKLSFMRLRIKWIMKILFNMFKIPKNKSFFN